MKKRISLYVVGLLSSLACRQEAVAPAAFCEFVLQRGLTASASETYTYQYDATNRLTQVVYQTGTKKTNYRYTYQGQQATIEVEFVGSDWIRLHYDVTLNERGYAVSAQETMELQINDTFEGKLTGSHTFGYDADGHLTEHQADKFSYPFGEPRRTETSWQRIEYVAGNPVSITHDAGTISNRYGTEPNQAPAAIGSGSAVVRAKSLATPAGQAARQSDQLHKRDNGAANRLDPLRIPVRCEPAACQNRAATGQPKSLRLCTFHVFLQKHLSIVQTLP